MDGKYTKKIGLLAMLPLLLLIPFAFNNAFAGVPSTATVNITGDCGVTVEVVAGFGSLKQGDTSPADVVMDLSKTGVTPSDLKIKGADWAGGSPATTMPVGQTHYEAITGGSTAFGSMITLTTTLAIVYAAGDFDSDADDIDQKLFVQLADTTSTGAFTQVQTLTVSC